MPRYRFIDGILVGLGIAAIIAGIILAQTAGVISAETVTVTQFSTVTFTGVSTTFQGWTGTFVLPPSGTRGEEQAGYWVAALGVLLVLAGLVRPVVFKKKS